MCVLGRKLRKMVTIITYESMALKIFPPKPPSVKKENIFDKIARRISIAGRDITFLPSIPHFIIRIIQNPSNFMRS